MTIAAKVQPLILADSTASLRHVFIRDLVVTCDIGVHPHEHGNPQRVRLNLDLAVREIEAPLHDDLDNVVCYEEIVNRVTGLVLDGHVNLVETLAERIAASCLKDPRVRIARVRVEKLDVFENAASVGIEIERKNS
ncbi:dihydroneopterin aldolase [Alphaproteobacteria bacterium HT1-32]|nr:dihydroneopterin aldolase [Alphaproteobacteria bacterium HT1-32]|tara:strand:- start:41406 stop:41813 length:408 start_codon:yes stop_codon:yes gene_type:complete